MLFERRAYKLRPGASAEFWALQREWNNPLTVPSYLQRCIGYFETMAGGAREIIHYYRYDSYDDWRSRLYGIYTADRAGYFASARSLLIAQDNMFLDPANVPAAAPLWCDGRDWLPGLPAYGLHHPLDDILAVETIIDLIPGGMPVLIDAYRDFVDDADGGEAETPIGTFVVSTGQLHRVIRCSWYPDPNSAERHRRGKESSVTRQELDRKLRPWVAAERSSYMRLAPLPWMRPLFETVEFS